MSINQSLTFILITVTILLSGCDSYFITQVQIVLPGNNSVDAAVASSSDVEAAFNLFKQISQDHEYPIKEYTNYMGNLSYDAIGPYWFGPMLTFKTEDPLVIIEVCQFAGLSPFPDYKKLKKYTYMKYVETFGKGRVTLKKIK
ncbi:MAG: hypothetical protein GY774_25330 [Planctomycetes bacterium]|nr:hypothetical protein [Planctomycetota bacterium]